MEKCSLWIVLKQLIFDKGKTEKHAHSYQKACGECSGIDVTGAWIGHFPWEAAL